MIPFFHAYCHETCFGLRRLCNADTPGGPSEHCLQTHMKYGEAEVSWTMVKQLTTTQEPEREGGIAEEEEEEEVHRASEGL